MNFLLFFLMMFFASFAHAQGVSLQGMLGNKALLVVSGQAPKMVAPGEQWQGVTVLSTTRESADIELNGQRQTLRLGAQPVAIDTSAANGGGAASGPARRIVLSAGDGGHFMSTGALNHKSVRFMVDTGATLVIVGAAEADRMGLRYRDKPTVPVSTANGTVRAWPIQFDSVRVGAVEVLGIDGLITPQPMPYALLGNSFLSRFSMKRENDQLTLERRF
jgi:aspartyl protease family protein